MEAAFQFTLRHLTTRDAVIVGVYTEYEDQVALNAGYLRRHSHLSQAA